MSERPLRFCMVTTFYPPHHFGGDGVYVRRLSSELVRRGHDVTVVHAPDAHGLLGGQLEGAGRAGDSDAIHVESLERRLGPIAPLVTPSFRL